MRIDLAALDPGCKLAGRIRDAIGRDCGQRSPMARSARPEAWTREEDLHRAIVAMIAAEARPGVIAFHVPNGGKRGKAEAGRLKSMGTVPGVPDLIVLMDGTARGLEIKTETGRLSTAQKFMAARFARAGCEFEVARSVAGARLILRRWGALSSEDPSP